MNISRINNDSTFNYQRVGTQNLPAASVPEERKDTYVSERGKGNKISVYVGPSVNTQELSDEQAKILAGRYDVTNMNSNEFSALVNDLYKSHVISLKESSMGTAGETPHYSTGGIIDIITKEPEKELPVWPAGNERANFLSLMDSYGKYCKSFADYAKGESADDAALAGNDYSDYYHHLHRIMQKIADAKSEYLKGDGRQN